jgi:hypothetical protein
MFKGTVSRTGFGLWCRAWSVVGLIGDAARYTFFRCSSDFLTQKVYFSRLMRVCVGLIMLLASAWSRFLCFLLVSSVWDISLCIGPCFPLAGALCKFDTNARGKRPMHHQPLLVRYKQQANSVLSMHNYTPLMINRNYTNKLLTLLSQRKLALTTFCVTG